MLQDREHRQKLRPAIMWLVLVFLCSAQISFAYHQFDHSIADTGETCDVCLQFEHYDDVVPDADGALTSVSPSVDSVAFPVVFNRLDVFPYYQSRASP